MKITRTKHGYTTVVYIGDHKSKRFSAPTRDQLRQTANDYLNRARSASSAHTFSDALTAYISAREAMRSASTIRSYKSMERALVTRYAAFCSLELASVNDDSVQAVVDDLHRAAYSVKTIRNVIGLINSVLSANKLPPARVIVPASPADTREIPTAGEVRMMLCLLHNHPLETPVKLALLGLRRGEICALTLDDLDRDGVIHIHRSKVSQDGGGHVVNASPKNDSSNRYVQLPPDLADAIRRQGYVTHMSPNTLTDSFRRFLKRYDFPAYRLHDCRHFFASYCHSVGVPEADILAGGGWKTAHVMRSVYRHSMHRNRASQAVGSLIGL